MKQIAELSLCMLLTFTLIKCGRPTDPTNLKLIDLHFIDTVKVNYDGEILLLSDIKNGKLVFFDYFAKEILITDLKGNIEYNFNNSLLGSDNFGENIWGVRFQTDTSVTVLSENGYFIYSLKGKIIKKYLHPFEVPKIYITGDFKLGYDYKRKMFISLLTTSTDLSSKLPEFYSQIKHLTVFKVDSQKYSWQINYEPESSFLQKEYFTSEWGAHFDISQDTIAMIYGRDPIVYLYKLSTFGKVTSFNTYPEHFKQNVKFKFNENTSDNHKLRLTGFSNSCYRKIFIKKDTVFTSYFSGIPIEVFDKIENLDDYNNLAYKTQKLYLQIFINGDKSYNDFQLPKEFPYLELLSDGRIFLSEQGRWRVKKDGYKRFLSANIRLD